MSSRSLAERDGIAPTTRALTFRCRKHANSSSKSLVIGPLERCPLLSEILDGRNPGVGRHRAPTVAIRASGVIEGIEFSNPDVCHVGSMIARWVMLRPEIGNPPVRPAATARAAPCGLATSRTSSRRGSHARYTSPMPSAPISGRATRHLNGIIMP